MARETVWVLLHPETASEIIKPGYHYPWQYYAITVVFFILVVVPASLIGNLSTIFGVTGATFGAAMYTPPPPLSPSFAAHCRALTLLPRYTGFPSYAYLKMLDMIEADKMLHVPKGLFLHPPLSTS